MAADIRIEPHGSRVDVVATAEVVDVALMIRLINTLAEVIGSMQRRRILLEVVAPECLVGIMDRVEIWSHAVRRELFGVKIAHVITGRPVGYPEVFKENYANNRGILVRTFAERAAAEAWLEEASGG